MVGHIYAPIRTIKLGNQCCDVESTQSYDRTLSVILLNTRKSNLDWNQVDRNGVEPLTIRSAEIVDLIKQRNARTGLQIGLQGFGCRICIHEKNKPDGC